MGRGRSGGGAGVCRGDGALGVIAALWYSPCMAKLSPIVSEFASTEEAEAYDVWFRAKVQRALDSKEPGIPHDEVMAEMRALIDSHRKNAADLAT